MTPAYICGPFTGPTPEAIAENVRRACALSRWAADQGFAPICVHPAIAADAYGSDDDPAIRERGIQINLAVVRMVAERGGHLFVIRRDDGTLSAGTQREVDAFREDGGAIASGTWAEWLADGVTP